MVCWQLGEIKLMEKEKKTLECRVVREAMEGLLSVICALQQIVWDHFLHGVCQSSPKQIHLHSHTRVCGGDIWLTPHT